MGSFYGNHAGNGGGSGGVSNYNELSNKPITNLSGLTAINFSTLTVGLYNIRGNYIYNENDAEVKVFSSPIFVKVLLDSNTGDKIVCFDLHENGKHMTYSIDYSPAGEYTVGKYTYEVISSDADTTEDLPAEGDISKIYATDDGLYVWSEEDQDYKKLGEDSESSEQTWDDM